MAIRKISGVDQETMNKIQSDYKSSEKVNQADDNTKQWLGKVQNAANDASSNGIISQKYWDRIDTDYQMSQNVQNAMNFTDELLAQLTTGKTSYSDQVDEMIKSIMNREKFSYDPDKDTLFQNALASAMKSGQSAMQDTIGQASALTGGYGSSYATSVGNQAYNSFIEDAYNNLPEYYEMALQTYQMDTADEYNKLSMLNTADDKEYGRLNNAYNANFQNWTQKYDMEYNQWRDSVNIALQAAGLELDESNSIFDRLGTAFSASNSFSDSLYEREYGQWRDSVSNAFNLASMENSDYWKQYSAAQSGSSKKTTNGFTSTDSTYKSTRDQLIKATQIYQKEGKDAMKSYIDGLYISDQSKEYIFSTAVNAQYRSGGVDGELLSESQYENKLNNEYNKKEMEEEKQNEEIPYQGDKTVQYGSKEYETYKESIQYYLNSGMSEEEAVAMAQNDNFSSKDYNGESLDSMAERILDEIRPSEDEQGLLDRILGILPWY